MTQISDEVDDYPRHYWYQRHTGDYVFHYIVAKQDSRPEVAALHNRYPYSVAASWTYRTERDLINSGFTRSKPNDPNKR